MEPYCRRTVQQAQLFKQERNFIQAMKTLSMLRRCCTASDCEEGANCVGLLESEWAKLQQEIET